MSAESMPTRKPTFSVLVIAFVKVGILKMRLKISKVSPLSLTKLSTSSIASG